VTAPGDAAIAVRQYAWSPGETPVDLDLGVSRGGEPYRRALVLVERDGVPLGVLDVPTADGVVRGRVVEELAGAEVDSGRWRSPGDLGLDAPSIRLRVVIPTCNNAQRVVRAVASVLRGPDPDLEVVVVENRPRGSMVASALAEAFPHESRVSYREEPRPGSSRARNCGAEGAEDGLVGFLDDDVVAHPHWVGAMRAASAERPGGLATGRILPLRLENEAQLAFQRFTGFGEQDLGATYRLDDPPGGSRLFPYAPGAFGSGASLCLPVSAFAALGGFDIRLGTGIPAKGGEDLDILVRALYMGYVVTYVPQAVVWHEHPDSLEGLPSKAFAYGVGLSAMMTKHALDGPDRAGLARRVPVGLFHLAGLHARKQASGIVPSGQRLKKMEAMEVLGLLVGPVAYARSLRQASDRRP
jgi:GT2 family glycosyltransferase